MHSSNRGSTKHPSLSLRPVPLPPGLPLVGNLLTVWRKGTFQNYHDNWQRYGDVVGQRFGPARSVALSHPEHINYVLVKNKTNYNRGRGYHALKMFTGEGLLSTEGNFWKRHRRFMQPPFTPRAVPDHAPAMRAVTLEFSSRWDECARLGQVLDMQTEMLNVTMAVIVKTMLGLDLDKATGKLVNAFTTATALVGSRITGLPIPLALPIPSNLRFKRALRTVDSFIYELIAERQRHPTASNDLLSQLLKAQDPESGQRMSAKQIRDELVTIIFAGHDTTAQTLTWACYLLSQHPDAEAQLHAEVSTLLQGRIPSVPELSTLSYTNMVLQETMRLYPPAWAIPRGAINDDEIGGYHIPAGSMVFSVVYSAHRHLDFWDEPERFWPERFATEKVLNLPPGAYMPFGLGARACIGRHFAMQEALLLIATFAQRYQLRLLPNHKVVPYSSPTLHPRFGLPMTITRR